MTKKIKDNQSIKPLVEIYKVAKLSFTFLDKFPFVYNLSPKIKSIKEQFLETEKMSHILDLPDQFNKLFSNDGWICYRSLSKQTLEDSVSLGLSGEIKKAHIVLIDSVDENTIDSILLRCKTRDHFKLRSNLLGLAKIDYLEKRYHACIPLLLALIDGLTNDLSQHIGFFTQNLDLELFDSVTAHSSGLPFLKHIMNSPRKKTNLDRINLPYRNGIMHGRDLNFANKEIASKCWWTLASLIDWSDEKIINNKKPKESISLVNTLKDYNQTIQYSKRINLWQRRPHYKKEYWEKQTLKTLDKTSPEYTLLQFLLYWKNRQWGLLNNLLVHTLNNKFATIKRLKEEYSPIQINHFSILRSQDETPAITVISIQLNYIKNQKEYTEVCPIHMNFLDNTGNLSLRNEADGSWYVLQLSLAKVLFD